MKTNYLQIITMIMLWCTLPFFMTAQHSDFGSKGKTRVQAYEESIKNQKNNVLSRSMTANYTTGYDSDLLESKLEYNSCVELAQISIKVVDAINQIGTFSNGIAGAGLQIDEGVVLSTGTISEMFTDNNAVLISEGISDANTIQDVDFDHLDPGGQSTHNESILVLDFTVPPGLDGIRVPFQFASDEFPEYVGTQFNDVFGFFVSGPGFENTTNIALVPGTNIPIAVNSINGGEIVNQSNAQNYPASGGVYLDHSEYYIDNTDGTNGGPIVGEYDGYSTLLYAEVGGLIPGETYQLKLGIADIADHYGDSGVYIGPLEGLYTGESIVDCYCDLQNDNLDCDKDGVINGEDCDPEDATVSISGDNCFDSNGDAGFMDDNCICIASVGGTSGGNSGGLESNNRLAQKIAKRNFNKKMKPSKIDIQKEKGEIPFKQDKNDSRQSGTLDLSELIPTDIWGAYVAESTPLDLIEITNAVDIIAADYYLNEVRSAVVLAIESENGVYEHSKYICDRLDGASLLDVFYANISGGKFIIYKIETASGLIEYATSFSGFEINGKFEIENHWNLGKYSFNENYYNFQIWSSSIEKTKSLLITILDKIKTHLPIGEIVTGSIPASFVSNGYYQNGKLHLNIVNKGQVEELDFYGKYRETETSEILDFETTMYTNLSDEESMVIETGYLYDMGLSMVIDENHSDELFVADGTWGYDDLNENSDVIDFQITSQNSVFNSEVYGVERGFEISANVKDYQNIFRSLTPKWQHVDLSNYQMLAFSAKGSGAIQVTIVSDQIENWEEQLSYSLILDQEENDYKINLNQFENYTNEQDLSKITMIVVSMIGNNTTNEMMNLTLKDIRFDLNNSITATDDFAYANAIEVYPNPVNDYINIGFVEPLAEDKILSVYNLHGQKLMEMIMKGGTEKTSVNVSQWSPGSYYLKIVTPQGNQLVERFIKK